MMWGKILYNGEKYMEKIQNKTEIQSLIFMLICLYFLLFSENVMPDNLLVFGLDIFLHFPSMSK